MKKTITIMLAVFALATFACAGNAQAASKKDFYKSQLEKIKSGDLERVPWVSELTEFFKLSQTELDMAVAQGTERQFEEKVVHPLQSKYKDFGDDIVKAMLEARKRPVTSRAESNEILYKYYDNYDTESDSDWRYVPDNRQLYIARYIYKNPDFVFRHKSGNKYFCFLFVDNGLMMLELHHKGQKGISFPDTYTVGKATNKWEDLDKLHLYIFNYRGIQKDEFWFTNPWHHCHGDYECSYYLQKITEMVFVRIAQSKLKGK